MAVSQLIGVGSVTEAEGMPVSEAVAVTPSIETGSAGDNEGDMSVWMPAATSPDGGDEGPKSPSGGP